MDTNPDELSQRVDDIEKTIGDFAQVLQALRNILFGNGNGGPGPVEPPTCPPYCAHWMKKDYKDDLPIADQIADMKRYIGDFGAVFQSLKEALGKMPPPDCPPYCGHGIAPGKKSY